MTSAPRIAVFPGTFDPVTNGHLDIIERSLAIADRVIVAVLVNTGKQPLFALDERVALLCASLASMPEIEVETFDGLLADFVRRRGARLVVRGVRSAPEFAEESQMALMNRHLNPACETVFLATSPALAHIASRLVREIALVGGSVEGLVPPAVAEALKGRVRPR